ncbi:hypothetical protein NDU88_005181, partial [Pleurodeles waltl]
SKQRLPRWWRLRCFVPGEAAGPGRDEGRGRPRMLKCTGFFRGIECPYERAGGEGRCRRPHCHFRHGARGGGNSSSNNNNTGGSSNNNNSSSSAESGAQELTYDPYSPELSKASTREEEVSAQNVPDSQLDILELERVNQAIEAVKSEVEREQKRYAELLETKKDYSVSEASLQASREEHTKATAKSDTPSTLKYDPGNYSLNNTTSYNPTPLTTAKGLSKYSSNASDGLKSKKCPMEYVPMVVAHAPKTHAIVNRKYVVDKSKPLTDLEYDPLSNYSARLLNKASKDQKRTKRVRETSQEDSYTPFLKKHCSSITSFEPLARFSDSEDDHDPESQPSSPESQPSLENKQCKTVSSAEKTPKVEKLDQSSRELKEMAVQYNVEDIKKTDRVNEDGNEEKKKPAKDSQMPSKGNKIKEMPKEKEKKNDSSKGSNLKDIGNKEKKKNVEKDKSEKGEENLKLKSS